MSLSSSNDTHRVCIDCNRAIGFRSPDLMNCSASGRRGFTLYKEHTAVVEFRHAGSEPPLQNSREAREPGKEFAGDEGKVTRDDERPRRRASRKRAMYTAERTPTRVNIRSGFELTRNAPPTIFCDVVTEASSFAMRSTKLCPSIVNRDLSVPIRRDCPPVRMKPSIESMELS